MSKIFYAKTFPNFETSQDIFVKKKREKICDWKLKNVNNFCDWVSKERFLKLFLDKVNYHSKKGHLFLSFFDFAFYFMGFVVKKIALTEKLDIFSRFSFMTIINAIYNACIIMSIFSVSFLIKKRCYLLCFGHSQILALFYLWLENEIRWRIYHLIHIIQNHEKRSALFMVSKS